MWITHGQEDALLHWSLSKGLKARPLRHCRLRRRGRSRARRGRDMNRFAEMLDRLAYEPARNAKLRLIADYLRHTGDPERGWALAALTGVLSFRHAKAGMIRALVIERTDPELFAMSYDYVGDLAETVALMWPADPAQRRQPHALAHRSRRDAVDARARPSCRLRSRAGLTRLTRRALGAAQASDRSLARRRIGAAGQDRRGIPRRQGCR